jgi:hypothetical protein
LKYGIGDVGMKALDDSAIKGNHHSVSIGAAGTNVTTNISQEE